MIAPGVMFSQGWICIQFKKNQYLLIEAVVCLSFSQLMTGMEAEAVEKDFGLLQSIYEQWFIYTGRA